MGMMSLLIFSAYKGPRPYMCEGPADDSESGLSLLLSLYKQHSPKHLSVYYKQPNMNSATAAILLCPAPAFLTESAGSMPGVRNQFNIETIGRKLKDTIAVDIQKNREILQELVDLQDELVGSPRHKQNGEPGGGLQHLLRSGA